MMVSFVLVLTGFSQMQTEEKVVCPVSGKEINKSEAKGSYEYKGKTYYFCCENCKKQFVENPEEYLSREGHEGHIHGEHGEHHEEGTVVDPVCGMKIEKDEAQYSHEYKGKTYYFCMEGCKEKFVEDPEKYVKAEREKVTCPVSGEDMNKSDAYGSMAYKGKTYYFCCAGCKEKFEKDPEKYIKKKEGKNSSTMESSCSCSTKKK